MIVKFKRKEHDPIASCQKDTIKSLVSGLRSRYSCNPNTNDISSLNDDEMKALSSISSFSFPSLNLFQSRTSDRSMMKNSKANNSKCLINARRKAVQNLTQSLLYVGSEIKEVPCTITKNVLQCFASIIDANLFQYFKRSMYNKSKNSPDEQKARKLSSTFFCNNNICSRPNVDVFTPIELESGATSFDIPSHFQIESNMFSVPLTVNIALMLRVQGKFTKVEMSCEGKIAGIFNSEEREKLYSTDLRLNTSELLALLRQGARKVILKAMNSGRDSNQGKLLNQTVKIGASRCSLRVAPAAIDNQDLVHISLDENIINNESLQPKKIIYK